MTDDEVARGEIWWAELPEPRGSEPGYRRPVLVIQAGTFNRSRLRTALLDLRFFAGRDDFRGAGALARSRPPGRI